MTYLSRIRLETPSLVHSRAFYHEVLGLPLVEEAMQGQGVSSCALAIGPSVIQLTEAPEDGGDEPGAVSAQVDGEQIPSVDHIALLVDEMDAAVDHLRQAGLDVMDPHTTAVGHRNMQRTLVNLTDPGGMGLQLSMTVDTRPQAQPRRQAKQEMSVAGHSACFFRGIDHISTYCAEFEPTRRLYRQIIGLEAFFHSTTCESGLSAESGFGQSAYAAGGTDIELATAGWPRRPAGNGEGHRFPLRGSVSRTTESVWTCRRRERGETEPDWASRAGRGVTLRAHRFGAICVRV